MGGQKRPVFIELSCGQRFLGRVVIELFDDVCPRTCENFRTLCQGTAGLSTCGTPLHYKGTKLFRIIPNFVIQGGDVTHNDGTGGECIWARAQGGQNNRYFPDENFDIPHASCGLLSMANEGPNTNQSQFFITCAPCPWLDGRNVVFGKVRSGHEVLSIAEGLGSTFGFVHATVVISDCGVCDIADLNNPSEEDTADMLPTSYQHHAYAAKA